mmetsp:Transcript_13642/g.43007  ORF Transcript_13642/g.43007 Transcript_13642/m.43007 type:complete len:309 (-) Transcript_13642:1452-2378(-)
MHVVPRPPVLEDLLHGAVQGLGAPLDRVPRAPLRNPRVRAHGLLQPLLALVHHGLVERQVLAQPAGHAGVRVREEDLEGAVLQLLPHPAPQLQRVRHGGVDLHRLQRAQLLQVPREAPDVPHGLEARGHLDHHRTRVMEGESKVPQHLGLLVVEELGAQRHGLDAVHIVEQVDHAPPELGLDGLQPQRGHDRALPHGLHSLGQHGRGDALGIHAQAGERLPDGEGALGGGAPGVRGRRVLQHWQGHAEGPQHDVPLLAHHAAPLGRQGLKRRHKLDDALRARVLRVRPGHPHPHLGLGRDNVPLPLRR